MSRRGRIIVFLLGAVGLAVLFGLAGRQLIGPKALRNRYAFQTNHYTLARRHVYNVVTAVNFDYRAFDTIGEEFILFVSVMGALVLLREEHKKSEHLLTDAVIPGRAVPASDSTRAWTLAWVAPKVLFGLYIVAHGTLSPGGGFQGGVILATAPLIIYLADGFRAFRRIVSFHVVEVVEALGAAAFVAIGFAGLGAGKEFLTNIVPLGAPGRINVGGAIPLINLATAMEVTGGFVLLLYVFLQDRLQPKGQPG